MSINSLYITATESWVGAEWTHDYKGEPPDGDSGDFRNYCEGSEPGCPTCARAEADAAEAERIAAEAMDMLTRAAELARQVRRLEEGWGDSPTWGNWARAVEGLT